MKESLDIEWWEIERVQPYHTNPRWIPQSAVDKVAKSLTQYGWRQPIVVKDGIIVVGHTRYRAALKLGLKRVPVHVADDLSEEKAAAYRLDDNRTGDETDWDYELLGKEAAALKALDYDMSSLAFEQMQIDAAIGLYQGSGVDGDPQGEWKGMPEYVRGVDKPYKTLIVHFPNQEAFDEFKNLVGQPKLDDKAKWMWHPKQPSSAPGSRSYVVEGNGA